MQVRLLGPLEVAGDDGKLLSVPGAKLRALMALLALAGGDVVPTDHLIDAVYGDEPPAGVANALQRLVSKLRKQLGGGDTVVMRSTGYALAIAADDVDVYRFERAAAIARAAVARRDLDDALTQFAAAEALWRGAALSDFQYEEFAQVHIARLNEIRLAALEERVDVGLALGRHSAVVGELEALVTEYPVRERLRAQLMLALYRAGRQAEALRVYQDGRAVLADELGLDPGPDLRQLETAILVQDPSLLAPVDAPAPAAPRKRTNVRPPLTPLVGRARELDEIRALLGEWRLVTLVGPGGAGKTRLAVETAQRSVEQTQGDVFVVELAAVVDGDAIVSAVAAALEVPEGGDPLARVLEHCAARDLLLVLDNCEHLVGDAARVAEQFLHACTRVRILATSREALRVPGETTWLVPPLGAPDAVELFVQRARSTDPTFELDADANSNVTDICTRLDGLPLAIELAAARVRAFSVDQIADRLDDRFRLLSGGSRTAMARQQTLRAVVDWSYDLLIETERRVFERLSVFPGGSVVEAADVVCPGDGVDRDDIIEIVASLVEKSLLVVDRTGSEPRYRMLQTLSQYGRERLVERGDSDGAFGRMAEYYRDLCGRGLLAVRGVDQRQWFLTIDGEFDNIHAAFDWAVGAKDKECAVAIAADLTFYRWVAGGAAEGFRWLDAALALPGVITPFTEGRGLAWHAFLGFLARANDHVDEDFDNGIELLRGSADPAYLAYALSFYAQVVAATGRREKSLEINRGVIDALDQCGDEPWPRAMRPWMRGGLALQEEGDFATYEAQLREALPRYRDAGDQFMTAVCLDLVAELDEARGAFDDAAAHLQEAIDIVGGWRMAVFEVALTARLANVSVEADDSVAEELLRRALTRAEELSYMPAHAVALNALANLRRRQERFDEAEAAANDALAWYRNPDKHGFSSSFSRAPSPSDMPVGAATALRMLGFVAKARDDTDTAIARFRSAYEQVQAVSQPRAVALAVEGLAAAAHTAGNDVWAAQLLGGANAVRSATGATPSPIEQSDLEGVRDAVIARLGANEFETAGAVGAGTGLAELVAG